ncbi:hypothetical protein WP2W18E01_24420 [Aeromonas caviae]|uniref:Uncharacterized protein n=1 Tax=Aeromonas caviae TaxID=648 RepID=A0A6S4T6S4_AERCA|nr:hypothetical protein WP2W18E01_24420 [Aeromonas caviae]
MLDTVALTFLGITLVDGLQRLCSKTLSSPSPARRNHSLPPYVDAIDDAPPIDSGTHHDSIGNRALTPFARSKIFSQTIGKRKGASRAPF